MGKTNYTILGIGLAACLLLSLMMQHALKVSHGSSVPVAVVELGALLGSRFSAEPEYQRRASGPSMVGEITVFPLLTANRLSVVRDVGNYLWRNLAKNERVDALVVIVDDGLGVPRRWATTHPERDGRRPIRLEPGDDPVAATRVERPQVPPPQAEPAEESTEKGAAPPPANASTAPTRPPK